MTYKPATHRAFASAAGVAPLLPLAAGIVCAVALGFAAFAVAWATGTVADVSAGREPDIAVRAPVTLYIMVGYLPMAIYYLGHWTDRHLEDLSRQFGLNPAGYVFPRLAANLLGSVGAAVMYGLFLHQSTDPWLAVQPGRWSTDYPFILFGLLVLGWFNFRFMFLLVWNALAVSRTARRIRHLDLLDTALLEPYARHAVRSSLLAIISISISANLWLDPESPAVASVTTLLMLVAATTLALLLPTWGIHQRLKAQKNADLKDIRAAIAARRDPQTRSLDDAQQLRADLALEQRLMDASEWPLDAGSYARVIVYILLGLGSWVGAALVERVLDTLG